MNRVGKALARWALKAAGYSIDDRAAMRALALFSGSATATGKPVSEESMLKISTAWCCIRILAETIGSLPWGLYETLKGGSVQRVRDHPAALLLDSPNGDMTSVEYREALMYNLAGHGNTYSRIERTAGTVVSLTPYRSINVVPKRRRDTGEVYYSIRNDQGQQIDTPRDQVWHVKGFSANGLEGLSPLAAAKETYGIALASEEYQARFFKQGAMNSGYVTIPGTLEEDQRDLARQKLQTMASGLANAHSLVLFENGMKPEPWGAMNLQDIQFLSLREFSTEEICRFYRVPPHMVADLRRATFSNIEHLTQEFVMFTLMPYFTRIESAFSKWILSRQDREKFFLRFNFEGLLRADSAGRKDFYASAVQNGWMTRNEVRAKENLNRVDDDGMDDFTAQTNLAPVDKLGAAADAAARKPSGPFDKSLYQFP